MDLHDDTDPVINLTVRTSDDKLFNMYGHQLISLWKELGLCLVTDDRNRDDSHSSLVPTAV